MTGETPADGTQTLDAYLAALFADARPSTLIELRWRVPGGMHQRFVPVGRRSELAPLIARLTPTTDVYVGVLPRWRRAGGREAVAGDCRTLWVDLDCEISARALEPVDPAPSLVIASGALGHLHAYWSLRTAVAPAVVERANRRLAWALGGDLASSDVARILRPPQSVNHRRGGVPVRLLDRTVPGLCGLAALVGGLPDPPSESGYRTQRRSRRGVIRDPLLSVAPVQYVHALIGQRPGRGHKVHCPLHPDRTPSLHVYEDPARGWYCFGCRRGGSVYDLAGALWGIEPRGAGMQALRTALHALLLLSPTS